MLRRVLTLMLPIFAITYMVAIGTYNGLHSPTLRLYSIIGLVALMVVWLAARAGTPWNASPLDAGFALWALAIGISLAANPLYARRIVIGIWFVLLYTGLWYVLHDLIRHQRLPREHLIDGLIVAGTLVLIIAFSQLQNEFLKSGLLLRPGSIFGNPNTLGAWLIVLVPPALYRAVTARHPVGRVLMGIYSLAALLLLGASFSRGAWLGMTAGMVGGGLLVLAHQQRLSAAYWHGWWSRTHPGVRLAATGGLLVIAAVVLATGLLFLRTFTLAGRTLNLRTDIYAAAVQVAAERPLTGYGLFTFGGQMPRYWFTPPRETHSHAHNLLLHVVAELGLTGLLALTVTTGLIIQAARRNWRSTSGRDRLLVIAAATSVISFAGHHLTDMPSMLPAIALSGLVPLALLVVPYDIPKRQPSADASLLAAGAIWVTVLLTGIWSVGNYRVYHNALLYATSEDYAGAAERMSAAISSDPGLALTYQQRGLLYALAGDVDAAAADFARYTSMEPNYAVGWANLGALRYADGDYAAAAAAFERTLELAPEIGLFHRWQGRALEATDDNDGALAAYQTALALDPSLMLTHEASALEQRAADPNNLTGTNRLAWLLIKGSAAETQTQWAALEASADLSGSHWTTLAVLVHLKAGDETGALALMEAAPVPRSTADRAWEMLAQARLINDKARLDQARALMEPPALERDEPSGPNVMYIQYLRAGLERQFVPQVGWSQTSQIVWWWLADA